MTVNRPIRILRVIARMNVGGPALQVSGLQRTLDREQFDSRLVTGLVSPGEEDYLSLRAPDVEAHVLRHLGRRVDPLSDVRALAVLRRHVMEFAPDIVHTHTAKAGVLGRVAAAMCDVPNTVHTFHGHLLQGYFSSGVTSALKTVERRLARRTSRLVAVGTQVRDDLLRAGIGTHDQFVVVPPGLTLPSPPSRSEARRALGLPQDAFIVGFTGRMTHIKRVDRMLQVARSLVARHDDILVIVTGEGPELPAAMASAAPLGDKVRFLGWRSDVEVVHAAADVALLTSDNEGMPVALIEAHMCGVPAVATDVGSVAEVVQHGATGLVVSTDFNELAEAVLTMYDDADLRRRYGARAREHAHQQFSLERLTADMSSLYRSLVTNAEG